MAPSAAVRQRANAIAEGRPELALRDEDRELLEDLVAEMLIAALERLAGAAK